MTSHMMDLTRLGQFHISRKVDFSLVIYHLTHLTFLVNLYDQIFELTYTINFHQSTLKRRRYWFVVHHPFKRTYRKAYTHIYWAIYDLGD